MAALSARPAGVCAGSPPPGVVLKNSEVEEVFSVLSRKERKTEWGSLAYFPLYKRGALQMPSFQCFG